MLLFIIYKNLVYIFRVEIWIFYGPNVLLLLQMLMIVNCNFLIQVFLFLVNLELERLLDVGRGMATKKIHDDVVSSNFHDEVLETFEDDDIFPIMLRFLKL